MIFQVKYNGHTYNGSKCANITRLSLIHCFSPHIHHIDNNLIIAENPRKFNYTLLIKHNGTNATSSSIHVNSLTVFLYPNPTFDNFSIFEYPGNAHFEIKGRNIDNACQKADFKVRIGSDNCIVVSLSQSDLVCEVHKTKLTVFAEFENIIVQVGNNLSYTVPKAKQDDIPKPFPKNYTIPYLQVGLGITIILCVVLFLLIYHFCYHNYISKKNSRMNKMCIESIALRQRIKQVIIENQIKLYEDSATILKLPNISIVDSEDLRTTDETSSGTKYLVPFDEKWEYPRENLSFGNDLGEGEFGKVVQAEALRILQGTIVTTVAVKMLKDDHSDEDMIDLVSEMEIMELIGAHVNVLQLLGCCTQGGELLIITEFAPHGNLRDFLRNHLPFIKNELELSNLTQKTLLVFAQQVANGMEYLASKKCVHRDLAARNVLVSKDYIMKVADFGLARDIRDKNYYRRETKGRLPVKWMAPEALGHNLYSTQSDVWSYGVLLWEIQTLGATPYPSFPDLGKLFKALHSGYRMEKPPNCSVELYTLMRKCWTYMPEERPSFTMIADTLEDILLTSTDDEVLQPCNLYWPEGHECSSTDAETPSDLLLE